MLDASLSKPWVVEREGNDDSFGCAYEAFGRLPGPRDDNDDLADVPSSDFEPVSAPPQHPPSTCGMHVRHGPVQSGRVCPWYGGFCWCRQKKIAVVSSCCCMLALLVALWCRRRK